jgi:hypothetical protein
METPKLNTNYTFEFEDGTTAEMTLTFYALYQLKSRDKGLYERYNKAMNTIGTGKGDELDSLTLLYVAYVCANFKAENLMTEEEFIIKCGCDRAAIGKAAKALTSPKN